MNKNINNAVELTEKELACVCGGLSDGQLKMVSEMIYNKSDKKVPFEDILKQVQQLHKECGLSLGQLYRHFIR